MVKENKMFEDEYVKFLEDVKCEDCVFHKDKCLHEQENFKLCEHWTDKDGRKPNRTESTYVSINGGKFSQHVYFMIDTKEEKVYFSSDNGTILEDFDESKKIFFMNATKDLCYTKDWKKYLRGSVMPKYETPCKACKYRKGEDCVHPKNFHCSSLSDRCCYWVSKNNIKAPTITSESDKDGKYFTVYVDTFKKKVYTMLYEGRRLGILDVLGKQNLVDLEYLREATKEEYYDDYTFPKPKKFIVNWDDYENSDIEEITTLWNTLTDKQKVKTVMEEEPGYHVIKKLSEIITEKELKLFIEHWNKLVQADKELYLPAILCDSDLLEEIDDEEKVVDMEKAWVSNTITYKSKFGKYYQYSYEGNYNWRYSYEMYEVQPTEKVVTSYE